MPKTFNQPKPVFKKEPDPRYEENRKRMLRAYQKSNYSFTEDSYQERIHGYKERMNIGLQRTHSDLCTETLVSVQRVLLPYPRMFEFENGELDTDFKVKSALVYKATVEIESEWAKKAGYHKVMEDLPNNAGQCTFTVGRYQRPIVEPTSYDRNGNVTNARIRAYYHTYFIEDTKANIEAILKRYNQRPRQGTIVAIANISGNPYSGSYSLVSENDIFADPRDIIEGNRLGLTAKAFNEWDTRKHKLIAGGKATRAELDKITDMDFLKMLKEKENKNQ